MPSTRKVAVFVGSLREGSFNRKVANPLIALASSSLKLEIVEIGHLGLYNQDCDPNYPTDRLAFKKRISEAGTVLFVTPEYSCSIPGYSRTRSTSARVPTARAPWHGKPGAVVSASPSAIGAFARVAPVAGVPERAGAAAAGGLNRSRR